jgi:L-lactate dehydrogenase complex protein LldG
MAARDTILAAVRAGLGGRRQTPEAIAAEAAALLAAPELIRPRPPAIDLVELFAERVASSKVSATLDRLTDLADLPDAVAHYLATQGLPSAVFVQPHPDLLALNWGDVALRNPLPDDGGVAVGLARWGIAETGSLVFHSGPETPILFNFLPLYHIVTVKVDSIVAHLEDYVAAASASPPPRNVNVITGASGTTDIEGSYVRGAHGPRFLHVVLVDKPLV